MIKDIITHTHSLPLPRWMALSAFFSCYAFSPGKGNATLHLPSRKIGNFGDELKGL